MKFFLSCLLLLIAVSLIDKSVGASTSEKKGVCRVICFVACRRPCAMCTQTCGPICLQACHQKKREVSYLKCILSLQLHVCLLFISFNFFDDSFLGVIHYHVTLRSGTRTEIATLKWKNFLPSCTPVSRRKIWQ